jgi:Fe-S cluster assembly protein SufD
MTTVLEKTEPFLANYAAFAQSLPARQPDWLRQLRKHGLDRYRHLGWPTPRNEDWKFTNLNPVARIPFALARKQTIDETSLPASPDGAMRLVFVNGFFDAALSTPAGGDDSLTVDSLSRLLDARPETVEPHLGKVVSFQEHTFSALNTAYLRDGAVVLVGDERVVEQPIYLVYVSTPESTPTAWQSRSVVVAGRHSKVTVIEYYLGTFEPAGGSTFTNVVTEVSAGPGAIVDHVKVQRESPNAYHLGTVHARQQRDSRFASHLVSLGGALVRNESRIHLADQGCHCTLNGLALARGGQHVDNHTVIDHARPHCESHELYKHILDGRAHAVFNGKIFVRPDAQKTDAKQTNQTLLLSDDAVINTKPQLEIYADDVKCTHGATVGQLDANALFYLRARGIGLEDARRILTFAFANDIVSRIQVEPLREELEVLLVRSRPGKEAV